MVELLLAKEGIGVRFPLAAPKETTSSLDGVFSFVKVSGIFPLRPVESEYTRGIRLGLPAPAVAKASSYAKATADKLAGKPQKTPKTCRMGVFCYTYNS